MVLRDVSRSIYTALTTMNRAALRHCWAVSQTRMALLGSVTNQNAAPYQIEDWREFIAQTGPFLLKTENGEVKIVAITGDPTRQYGTSLAEIGTVRVTYGWTEVDDIKRAVIT